MILDEKIYRIIEKAEDIINTKYTKEIYWLDKDEYKGYIEGEALLNMVEELMYILEQKEDEYKEELEYLRQDTDPNYDYYEEQKLREEN